MKEIVSEYLKKYIDDDDTMGILLTGSVGRKENDVYSDIDWVRIVKNKNNSGFKEEFKNILFDCRCENLNELMKLDWNMEQYYAYFNCYIYYDKNNSFLELINNKRHEWNDYVKKIIAIKLVECSVYISFPNEYFELKNNLTHFEKFVLRNDFYSSYNCLKIINSRLIDLCFLLNNQPIPDEKNKFRNIENYVFADYLRKLLVIPCCNSFSDLIVIYEEYKNILNILLKEYKQIFQKEESYKKIYYKYRGKIC